MFNKLKVLSGAETTLLGLLAGNPKTSFYSNEAAKKAGLSVGSASTALNALAGQGFVSCEKKGKMKFYRANLANAATRSFKVFSNCLALLPLAVAGSGKLVLYGSAAAGGDTEESDFDLACVTGDKRGAADKLAKTVEKVEKATGRKVSISYFSEADYHKLAQSSPAFYDGVEHGLVIAANAPAATSRNP
ncbi:MAG: nucleotidyltransferase domain-containing protein [Candidatus Micrarchaeia archaeon]